MRAPPPVVKIREIPPADRLADWRNAAGALDADRELFATGLEERLERLAFASAPWSSRSASSADRPRSRCRSSLKRRVPTGMSRVSTGTPSSRMLMLVVSCPMLTRPTTPCMASG